MPSTTARTTGQGYTTLYFGGPGDSIPIAFMRVFTEQPPKLVADPVPVHPLDFEHPAEIMTAKAIGEGTITVDFIESWSEQAWNRLAPALSTLGGKARGGTNPSDNILDIVRAVDNAQGEIYLSKLINTPQHTTERNSRNQRAVLYMGAKIVDVGDGDTDVAVNSMDQMVQVTFMYTHRLYQYRPIGGTGYKPSNPPFPTLSSNRPSRLGPQLNSRI